MILRKFEYKVVALVVIILSGILLARNSLRPNYPSSNSSSQEIVEFTGQPLPTNTQLIESSKDSGIDSRILFKVQLPSSEVLPWFEKLKGSELSEELMPVTEDDFDLKKDDASWWNIPYSSSPKRIYFSNYPLNRHYVIYAIDEGQTSTLYVSVHST